MSKRLTPASALDEKWMRKPAYAEAFAALEDEFQIVSELIKARAAAGLTQEQLAERMRTTRTAIARLESGRQMPSTRTLAKFAEATGYHLRITFEKSSRQPKSMLPATASKRKAG